jgi:hypothetical protein
MHITGIERKENYYPSVMLWPYMPESVSTPLGIREAFLFKSLINRT